MATYGEFIELSTAEVYLARFREQYPEYIKAEIFTKSFIEELIAQPGCEGVRIYNGIDDEGVGCYVLVATNSEDQDMVDNCLLLEGGGACPRHCDVTSPLYNA